MKITHPILKIYYPHKTSLGNLSKTEIMMNGLKKKLGISLLEVMLTLFIFSVGLLGTFRLLHFIDHASQKNLWRAMAQMEWFNGYHLMKAKQFSELPLWEKEVGLLLPKGKVMFSLKEKNPEIRILWEDPKPQSFGLEHKR